MSLGERDPDCPKGGDWLLLDRNQLEPCPLPTLPPSGVGRRSEYADWNVPLVPCVRRRSRDDDSLSSGLA